MITILNNGQFTTLDNAIGEYARKHLNWYCSPRTSFTTQVEEHTKICDVILILTSAPHKDKQVGRIRSFARNLYPKTVFNFTAKNIEQKTKEVYKYIIENDCQKLFIYTDNIYKFNETEEEVILLFVKKMLGELSWNITPRYALFAWKGLHAQGGWGDLVESYTTLQGAINKKNKFVASDRAWYEWHIVDLKRGIVIEKGK
jgi:hypothetical protein